MNSSGTSSKRWRLGRETETFRLLNGLHLPPVDRLHLGLLTSSLGVKIRPCNDLWMSGGWRRSERGVALRIGRDWHVAIPFRAYPITATLQREICTVTVKEPGSYCVAHFGSPVAGESSKPACSSGWLTPDPRLSDEAATMHCLGFGVLVATVVGCGPSITKGLTPTIETTASLPEAGCSSISPPLVDHPDLELSDGNSGCTLEARVGDLIAVATVRRDQVRVAWPRGPHSLGVSPRDGSRYAVK